MKIQSLAVIFAIIILPVIVILSYYIHKEVDTITIQTSYDTKLIDATHDAMASFELNTANEDLSGVADALRSIIEASNNVFFNSLATNLGVSNANKDYVQPYIPAILYTLYDGYYIYSPTRIPEVLVGKDKDGNDELVHIGDLGVKYKGNNSDGIGVYRFNQSEFDPSEDKKQTSLYDNITNKYEYGQLLYKNNNNTYSPTLNSKTYYKQDYVLKSYMPYSARYKGENNGTNYDLTINYTLDNYITVIGYIGDIYYSKTGYLISKDVIENEVDAHKNNKNIKIDDNISNLLTYNEIYAEEECFSGKHKIELTINPFLEDGVTRSGDIEYKYEPYIEEVYAEDGSLESTNILSYKEQQERLNKFYEEIEKYYNEYRISTDEGKKSELLKNIKITNTKCQKLEESLENLSAITYYIKAQIFSNWIYDNLGKNGLKITEDNLQDDLSINNDDFTTDLSEDAPAFYHNFSGSTRLIFDESQDPENIESNFASHKFDVIRNSIQYNLNLALSIYDRMTDMDIKMPVISDTEWEKILNNVSIVSFMQGFNCGLKQYNNYAVVSSTNNELTVIPDEIFYVNRNAYNVGDIYDIEDVYEPEEEHIGNAIYHRIDCENLEDTSDLISFRSKEVKYDKIYDKSLGRYKYDHKNFGCYNCILNSNYLKRINPISEYNPVMGYNNKVIPSALTQNKRKAFYRAIGKARQNIYKTNALIDSNGYEIVYDTSVSHDWNIVEEYGEKYVEIDMQKSTSRNVTEISAIEITVKNVRTNNVNNSVATFNAVLDGVDFDDELVLNFQETPQTLRVPIDFIGGDNLMPGQFRLIQLSPGDEDVLAEVLNVKVIYE